jgi:predicted alpha/beta-hydrolase family hydrolase
MMVSWRIGIGADVVSATLEPASSGASAPLLVLAHGAGGHMADRGMLALSATLAALDLNIVRFNFVYREKASARPDPMPRLMECVAAVAAHAVAQVGSPTLLLGGRSMGGRAASMLVADGYNASGLMLYAYPLHPAGQTAKRRDAHLPRIAIPVLCVNGTRDTLCEQPLMDETLARLGSNWMMHWLEAADHSFHVTKASGRTDREVLEEVGTATADWLARVVNVVHKPS